MEIVSLFVGFVFVFADGSQALGPKIDVVIQKLKKTKEKLKKPEKK